MHQTLRPSRKWFRTIWKILPTVISERLVRGNRNLRFDYIFIISYGRSGSTLLQGVLNTIRGVLIRGENNNVVEKLYQADKALRGALRFQGLKPETAWYGIESADLEAFRSGLRRNVVDCILRPGIRNIAVGFKEIRYTTTEISDADFEEYLDFMRTVFPRAAFVFNTRDLSEVVTSKWWADDPDSMRILSATEDRFHKYLHRKLPDCFHVHYNDYVEDATALIPLFDFLGAKFDQAKVQAAMSKKHSY